MPLGYLGDAAKTARTYPGRSTACATPSPATGPGCAPTASSSCTAATRSPSTRGREDLRRGGRARAQGPPRGVRLRRRRTPERAVGQEVVAVVRSREGRSRQLTPTCSPRPSATLARYKLPKAIVFVRGQVAPRFAVGQGGALPLGQQRLEPAVARCVGYRSAWPGGHQVSSGSAGQSTGASIGRRAASAPGAGRCPAAARRRPDRRRGHRGQRVVARAEAVQQHQRQGHAELAPGGEDLPGDRVRTDGPSLTASSDLARSRPIEVARPPFSLMTTVWARASRIDGRVDVELSIVAMSSTSRRWSARRPPRCIRIRAAGSRRMRTTTASPPASSSCIVLDRRSSPCSLTGRTLRARRRGPWLRWAGAGGPFDQQALRRRPPSTTSRSRSSPVRWSGSSARTAPARPRRCGRSSACSPSTPVAISWNGAPVDRQVRTRFGYMPAERGLYPSMKVLDHVVYFARSPGWTTRPTTPRRRAGSSASAWPTVRTRRSRTCRPATSSGCSWPSRWSTIPSCSVLDEPFSGLDPVAVAVLEGAPRRARRPPARPCCSAATSSTWSRT